MANCYPQGVSEAWTLLSATLALLLLAPLMACFLLVRITSLALQYFGAIDLEEMVNCLLCPNFGRCISKRRFKPLIRWTTRLGI